MKRVRYKRYAVFLSVVTALACGQGCPPTTNPGDDGNNGGDGGGTQNRGLGAENARVAIQSQCAQNVIVCTVTFPTPRIQVVAGVGQQVTQTAKGFRVQGADGNGSETVNLIGSNSDAGQQGALGLPTQLFFSWSQGASDANPLTLAAGTEFSKQPNPSVLMSTGFHYVRLTVTNDIFRDEILSPAGDVVLRNVYQSKFLEVEIEVRD